MSNKNLFRGTGAGRSGVTLTPTDTVNNAGGEAYSFGPEHELAQLACTGMLGDTYYVSAVDQLARVIKLAQEVSTDYLAKLAVYSREQGKMKDMPALVCAVLFGSESPYARKVLADIFPRVIDNGRMLRNFVQMVRSGQVGRKSLGSFGKKLIQAYFDRKTPDRLFKDSVGNDPSLADVIKLAHPRPTSPERQALYRYIIGRELNSEQRAVLPQLVKDFEAFKTIKKGKRVVPDVPFQMLTALDLSTEEWTQIALNGGWQFVRMNLNTFARHGVLDDKKVVKLLADKLSDEKSVEKARVFPYQLLIAYLNTDATVPEPLKNALQDAMEVATKNVPEFNAPHGVQVYVDVSGSMSAAVSGNRGTATTAARCLDVAALIAAAVLRKNESSEVVAFDTSVHRAKLNSRDTVMTNAAKLKAFGGGGTDCHLPLADANARKVKSDLVIYVSDNESWVDAKNTGGWYTLQSTAMMDEWKKFKARNPKAKMVNINLTPAASTQASNDDDIINIGGFSDTIFEVISAFVNAKSGAGSQWVEVIERTNIETPVKVVTDEQ